MSLSTDRGGEHAPMATQLEVMARLAEGDASASWVASVYNAVGHMICAFGDQALDEYANSSTPRSAGVFAVTGKATKVDGGYQLSGKWAFASGQHHAEWILVPGIADDGADGPLVWSVPKSEFTVEDDWYVTGFVATGSNAVSLSETFVPDHRTVPFADIVEGRYRQSSFSGDPYSKPCPSCAQYRQARRLVWPERPCGCSASASPGAASPTPPIPTRPRRRSRTSSSRRRG
jgi:alkylation response protein AidB-like acyl-CoA dehydrogenase